MLPPVQPDLFQSTDFIAAIVGALIGSIAGGFITFLVQRYAVTEARRDRKEDLLRVQQALASALVFKMMRIHGNLLHVHQHIEDGVAIAEKEGVTDDLWRFVQPIANLPSLIRFTSEEMGMLLAQKDNDFFNAMQPMDEVHNAVIETLAAYQEQRAALTDALPAPTGREEDTLGTTLSSADYNSVIRLIINTNSLINQLRPMAAREAKLADELLGGLSVLLKERGLANFKLERKQEPPTEAT